MTILTQSDFALISDLHKDARGFRPSQDWLRSFDGKTYAEKEAIWDGLIREMDASVEAEKAGEARALAALEARIADTIALGAGDYATAVRWLMQASDETDVAYWLWQNGISSYEVTTPLEAKIGFKAL